MNPHVQKLLTQLDKVRRAQSKKHPESFTALCPAHDDKNPSLCVDVTHDGRILLYCRAGCGAAEILTAVGFSMSELFPDSDYQRPPGYPQREIDYSLDVARVCHKYQETGRQPIPNDLQVIERALKVLHFTRRQLLSEVGHAR